MGAGVVVSWASRILGLGGIADIAVNADTVDIVVGVDIDIVVANTASH